ncbi:hypothetical protein KI387_018482, partial [Taxus chinensis]
LMAEDKALKAHHDEKECYCLEIFKDLPQVLLVSTKDEWYADILYFLTYGEYPPHMDFKYQRNLKMKVVKYVIWNHDLYKRSFDGCFLKCVDKAQHEKLLKAYHDQACGGYFSAMVTTHKILSG